MKKDWKRLGALLFAFALALSLMACGGNSAAAQDSAASVTEESVGVEYDYGYANESPAEEPAAAEMATTDDSATIREGGTGAGQQTETKLVYTAYLEVEALDFDAATDALDKLVEKLGGYYECSSVHSYSKSRTASYTVRVPSEHYREFVDACSNSENCHLNYISEEVEDIGAEYFDAETRLNTLKTKMERLQALLAEATLMEDIITIETAISETEYEIELYTSTLNRYDSLVGFATVNLEMYEVIQLTEEEEESVLSRLGQELRWGVENFVDELIDVLYWAAYNLIGIVIFAVVVAVLAVVLRRAKKKGKMKVDLKGKKQEEKTEEKTEQ